MVVSLEFPKSFIFYFVLLHVLPKHFSFKSDLNSKQPEKLSTTLYKAHNSSQSSHLNSHQALCEVLKNKLIQLLDLNAVLYILFTRYV